MRLRVMRDGKPEWTENEPSRARAHGYLASASMGGFAIGGELVQGEPGIVERDRQATKRSKAKRAAQA